MSRYGDLLRDLRNPNLSRQRLDDIVRQFNEFGDREERYKSWLQFRDGNPTFNNVSSIEGTFEVSPIEAIFMTRTTDLSVANATNTSVPYGSRTKSTNILQIAFSNAYRFPTFATARTLGFIGQMNWAANATGRRNFAVRVFDKDLVQLYGTTLVSLPAHGAGENGFPIAGSMYIPDTNTAHYLDTMVYQDSGGALDLTYIALTIFALI